MVNRREERGLDREDIEGERLDKNMEELAHTSKTGEMRRKRGYAGRQGDTVRHMGRNVWHSSEPWSGRRKMG